MFYRSSVSLTCHWLHCINWILSVTYSVFPLKDTWNLNSDASKCSVYCSVSGQRLHSSMFHSSASRQEFQSSQLCHSKFIVIPFKAHSYANRQKFQSPKFITLPMGRSSKVQSSKFIVLPAHRGFKAQRFIRKVLSNVSQFINCVKVPQLYQQVENTVPLISMQRSY